MKILGVWLVAKPLEAINCFVSFVVETFYAVKILKFVSYNFFFSNTTGFLQAKILNLMIFLYCKISYRIIILWMLCYITFKFLRKTVQLMCLTLVRNLMKIMIWLEGHFYWIPNFSQTKSEKTNNSKYFQSQKNMCAPYKLCSYCFC